MRLQRTIKKPATLHGVGIHTGEETTVTMRPAPVDTGVIFIRDDISVPAHFSNISKDCETLRATSISIDSVRASTIEHLTAALNALAIDNVEIELDGEELPAMDGSALDYSLALMRSGVVSQQKEKREFVLKEAVWCQAGDALMIALPSQSYTISYLLRYGEAGGMTQYARFSFEAADEGYEAFIKELAPARTFCFEEDVASIKEKGLGRGGNYKNALVLREGRPIENEFRFDNEPARHKVLDICGDLALLGIDIKAHIIGIKSGHSLNRRLLRRLSDML